MAPEKFIPDEFVVGPGIVPEGHIYDDANPEDITAKESPPDPELVKTRQLKPASSDSPAIITEMDEGILRGVLGGTVLFKLQDRNFTRRLRELIGDDPTGEKFAEQLEEFERNILGGRSKKSDEQSKLLEDFRKIFQDKKSADVEGGVSMVQTEPLVSAAIESQLARLAEKLGKKLPAIEPAEPVAIGRPHKKKSPIRRIWDRITGNREAA